MYQPVKMTRCSLVFKVVCIVYIRVKGKGKNLSMYAFLFHEFV